MFYDYCLQKNEKEIANLKDKLQNCQHQLAALEPLLSQRGDLEKKLTHSQLALVSARQDKVFTTLFPQFYFRLPNGYDFYNSGANGQSYHDEQTC